MKKSNMNKDRLKCSLAGAPGFLTFVLTGSGLYSIPLFFNSQWKVPFSHDSTHKLYINVIF